MPKAWLSFGSMRAHRIRSRSEIRQSAKKFMMEKADDRKVTQPVGGRMCSTVVCSRLGSRSAKCLLVLILIKAEQNEVAI